MKKINVLSVIALSSAALLAGCGTDDPGAGAAGHFSKPVTIKFVQAYAQEYQDTLQDFINGFKEIEPNVNIDLASGWLSGNYDTIHTQTVSDISSQTGEYGDLVIAYGDHAADYMDWGKLVQLDEYINHPEYGFTQEEKDDLVQGFLTEGQSLPQEGTWLMPFSKSTEAMYYNYDALVGLDLSAYDETINNGLPLTEAYINNLTWEELFDKLCPAFEKYDAAHPNAPLIVKQNQKALNSYVGYDSDANLFITLAEQYGYGYTSINNMGEPSLDFNNANMKGLVKKFAEASKKGYFRTAGCANEKNSYCSSLFKAQNCLFCIGSTAGVKNQNASEFVTKIARIPQAEGKSKKIISQGPGLCILDHGDEDRKLAAWLFYKYLTNPENSAVWGVTVGYMPVRTSSYQDEMYMEQCATDAYTPGSLEYLKALDANYSADNSQYYFSTPSFRGSSTARTQVGSLVLNALIAAMNGVTVNDAYLNNAFNLAIQNIRKDM